MQVKNGSPDVTINSFTGFLKVSNDSEDKDEVVLQGVASSGCWAVIEDLDRAPPEVKLFIPAVFTQTDILIFTIQI